jgi:hypothetical protein
MKAPYMLPNEKIINDDYFIKMTTKPVGSFLKFHGKPVDSRYDLDVNWDEVF